MVKVGEEIFAGLTSVNMAGRASDPRISLALAKSGAEIVSKGGQKLSLPTGHRF